MLHFGVTSKKEKNLLDEMERLGIRESDLIEKFITSGGRGGQHVNRNATCCYLKHKPTGIEVKCSRERSQSLNRFFARRILADKIDQKITGKISEKKKLVAKIRRQKRKRSKRAKEKILKDKKKISFKKSLRKNISVCDEG